MARHGGALVRVSGLLEDERRCDDDDHDNEGARGESGAGFLTFRLPTIVVRPSDGGELTLPPFP